MFPPIACCIAAALAVCPPVAKDAGRNQKLLAALQMLPHQDEYLLAAILPRDGVPCSALVRCPGDSGRNITRLTALVSARPDDGWRLSELAKGYRGQEDFAIAAGVGRLAIAFLRERTGAFPDDVEAMVALAEELNFQGLELEADGWFQRALASQPRRWQTWSAMGSAHGVRAAKALLAPGERLSGEKVAAMLMRVLAGEPMTESEVRRLDAARAFVKPALDCADWAVIVAPDDPDAYRQRIDLRLALSDLMAVGKAPLSGSSFLSTFAAVAGDAMTIARLKKDDAGAWASAYALSAALALLANESIDAETESRSTDPGIAQDAVRAKTIGSTQKRLGECLCNLERLSAHPDSATRRSACSGLATAFMLRRDFDGAARALQKLAPEQRAEPAVFSQLAGCLRAAGRYQGLVAEAQSLVYFADTPVNRARLARAYDCVEDAESAKLHLETALRANPDEPTANLGMACWLLRRGEGDDLAEVDRLLDRVERWLSSAPAAAPGNATGYADTRHPIWQTLTELRGVRAALAGDRVKARALLMKAQEGGQNQHATDLLLALE